MNITKVSLHHINETNSPVHVLLRQDEGIMNIRLHKKYFNSLLEANTEGECMFAGKS